MNLTPDILSILNSAVGMACGAAITGVAAYIYNRFRRSAGFPSRLSIIEDACLMMLRQFGDLSTGTIASLEAHKGKCNGNVDSAIEVLKKSERERTIFFEKLAIDGSTRNKRKGCD